MDLDTALNDKPLPGSRATDLLRADHEAISALFDDYQIAMDEDSPTRETLAHAICIQLDLHGRMESEIFYPIVSGEDPDLVAESVEDHDEIAGLIAVLGNAPLGEELDARVLELIDLVESHIAMEEEELFPLLEERIDPTLRSLGLEMIRYKETLVGSTADVAARA